MIDKEKLSSCPYSTPLYVFDTDELSERIKMFREIIKENIHLCFAMKANPFLVRQMENMVDRIEVCSMGEFRICKALEISPEKLLISGVLKKKEELGEILACYGHRCCYTVESSNQFKIIADWCKIHQENISIYLRLTSGNQFGIDEQMIKDIIGNREKYPLLNIKGLHYFSGTQKKSTQKIEKELNYLKNFCKELEEDEHFFVEELEYGPGLAVNYFENQMDTTKEDLSKIVEVTNIIQQKRRITFELGRALCATCGYYLTTIKDIKQNNGQNYCIVDGGIHQLNYDGQIKGMYRPHLQIAKEIEVTNPRDCVDWTICGALCTVNDLLVQKFPAANLEVGDILIFERTGAYAMTEGMSLFLSHPLPQIVLYSKKLGWKLIRDKQPTYQLNKEDKEEN